MMMSEMEKPFLTSAHSAPGFQRPRLEIIIYLIYCKLLLCMSAFLSVAWVNMNCLIKSYYDIKWDRIRKTPVQ